MRVLLLALLVLSVPLTLAGAAEAAPEEPQCVSFIPCCGIADLGCRLDYVPCEVKDVRLC